MNNKSENEKQSKKRNLAQISSFIQVKIPKADKSNKKRKLSPSVTKVDKALIKKLVEQKKAQELINDI